MNDSMRWYALRSKPRKELVLAKLAREHGHTIFYPRLRVKPVNPRASHVRPYFPGYMFVHANLAQVGIGAFQWMPYSLGLVSFGSEPASVPESVILGLQDRVEEAARRAEDDVIPLNPGDHVRVKDGPLAGYEGIFEAQLSGTQRVKVLLAIMHDNYKSVELDGRQLEY
jgi:transcription antitermination factor NusG